jgi:uncharacterized protein YndB with AHSA1/START domain
VIELRIARPALRTGLQATLTSCFLAAFVVTAHADGPTIRKDIVVNAPIEKVWHAWTTNEGARAFFSPRTNIELRPGGPYEIFFLPDAPEGQRGSEGCRVLAFDPPRMVSFTWNAPPSFGELRDHHTHVTVRLEPQGPDRTIVRLVHEGFGESEAWLEVRDYFDKAWERGVLPSLVKSFEN